MRLFVLTLVLLFSVISCQTNRIKNFEAVRAGMDKGDVLELLENPTRTYRKKGIDKWSYDLYSNGILQRKEIHFYEGYVVYLGEPQKPEVSAEHIDNINREVEKGLSNKAYF